jgi:hypothetical protein
LIQASSNKLLDKHPKAAARYDVGDFQVFPTPPMERIEDRNERWHESVLAHEALKGTFPWWYTSARKYEYTKDPKTSPSGYLFELDRWDHRSIVPADPAHHFCQKFLTI